MRLAVGRAQTRAPSLHRTVRRSERASAVCALIALSWWLVGCGGPGASARPVGTIASDTRLGVGDLFEVRVYQEDELTNEFRVSPDGTIDFPLVGRVEVLGLQPSEVADRVRDRLRDGGFFREPQVSVLVREYASKRISVVGAVERPGTFPVAPGMTVVQAISQAGGFTPLASRNDVVLTRRVEGELRRYPVAVDAVANGRQEDIPVLPGDIIYIRERVF